MDERKALKALIYTINNTSEDDSFGVFMRKFKEIARVDDVCILNNDKEWGIYKCYVADVYSEWTKYFIDKESAVAFCTQMGFKIRK